jgi:SAM-dependent methyltransferase
MAPPPDISPAVMSSPSAPFARNAPLPLPVDAPLAAYLIAEPLVAGKVVLDVGPRPARAAERLARGGAREVLWGDGPGPALELSDQSVDVVMCVARLSAAASEVERHRWLAELRRVLRPDGFCLLRVSVAVLQSEERSAAQVLEELVLTHFGICDLVPESPLVGVAYLAPGTEDVAVNEELARISGPPAHLVVLCAAGPERPWSLPESLLIPLSGAGAWPVPATPEDLAALREEIEGLLARHEAACRERDALREAAMTVQDRADQLEDTLSALRRETERHLRQISDDAAALELAALERERLERRSASAERALESQATQLHRRTADLVALERELARLRATGADSPRRP